MRLLVILLIAFATWGIGTLMAWLIDKFGDIGLIISVMIIISILYFILGGK